MSKEMVAIDLMSGRLKFLLNLDRETGGGTGEIDWTNYIFATNESTSGMINAFGILTAMPATLVIGNDGNPITRR